jgi:predicted nuclease of predicted toxin-antitoxin system
VKIVVDMNLSPDWVLFFHSNGIDATHWSGIGAVDAADTEIMEWARANGALVMTHDLDFGITLALTRAAGPSVLQVRAQDVTPKHLGEIVLSVIERYRAEIAVGVLITIDEARSRVRLLPIAANSP